MTDLLICRICLRTNSKTYRLDQYQLGSYYEEVMALKVCEGDLLPQRFCYECAVRLHRYHKFKEKCHSAQQMLNNLLRQGPLSYEAVYNFKRAKNNLKSALDLMTVTNRVKCYFIREEHFVTEIEREQGTHDSKIAESKICSSGKFTDTKNMLADDTRETNISVIKATEDLDVKSTDIVKSVMCMDITDKAVQDSDALETNGKEMAPVIEFIDLKKEGVKLEELLSTGKKEEKQDKTCKRNTALLIDELRSELKRECPHCGNEFRRRCMVCAHSRSQRRARHARARCGAAAATAQGLARHMSIRHPVHIQESAEPDSGDVTSSYSDAHLLGGTAAATEDELGGDTKTPNEVLDKRKRAKVLEERSENNSSGVPKDPAALATSERKRRRKLKKLKRKPTTCYQCGAQFPTQAECMRHHVTQHPRTSFYAPAQRHVCEICGASLAPSSVAAHQNMHSRAREFRCDTCGRAFHAAVGLKRHLVTHTGEKRYACAVCDKRFTQNNSMKLHYRTAHLKQPYPKRNRRRNPSAPAVPPAGSDQPAAQLLTLM